MAKLEDARLTIRSAVHTQTADTDPTTPVIAAVRRLFTTARWDGFDPAQIDLSTIRVNRIPDGITATARYGRLADDCDTCHQTPGRPHTDFCHLDGLVS